MSAEENIRQWKGGTLSVYQVRLRERPVGANDQGATEYELDLEYEFVRRAKAVPVGEGFAALLPARFVLEELGVQLELDVRAGRLQLAGITSLPDGPELTQILMRRP